MLPVEAVNSASAHLQRPDRKTGTDADASGSLGAVKSLVAGEAQDIDPHTFHIHGDCARRLRSVYDKQKTVLFCEGCRLLQIGDVAGQVGGVGDDQGFCVRTEQGFQLIVSQDACLPFFPGFRLYRKHRQLHALQPVQGPQHGIVLADGGNHMIPRPEQAAKRQVQALGGIGRKDHLLRSRRAQKLCQAFSGSVDDPSRVKGRVMDAPSGISHGSHGFQKGLPYTLGLLQGGRPVIQINHGLTIFAAPAMVSAMTYILVTSPTFKLSVSP